MFLISQTITLLKNVRTEAKKEFRKQMTLRKIKNEKINLYDIVG